jgi:hypothetical protein
VTRGQRLRKKESGKKKKRKEKEDRMRNWKIERMMG